MKVPWRLPTTEELAERPFRVQDELVRKAVEHVMQGQPVTLTLDGAPVSTIYPNGHIEHHPAPLKIYVGPLEWSGKTKSLT